MELTNVEISVLVDYHENEIVFYKRRLDHIRDDEISDRYDNDLRDAQIDRINEYIGAHDFRIEELMKLREELKTR